MDADVIETALDKARPNGPEVKELARVDHDQMPVVNGIVEPRHSGDISRLATLAFKAGLAPKGAKTQEQAIMGIMAGMEVGLTFVQSCRQVMVVNGSPSLWGDAPLALVMKSGQLEDVQVKWEGEGDKLACVVIVKRKSVATAGEGRFGIEDAKKAGLWGKSGPWTQYPKRMLELRARAFALRNTFPDALLGCAIAEEIEDVEPKSDTAELNRRIEIL